MPDSYFYNPTAAQNYTIVVTASDAFITDSTTFNLEAQNPIVPASTSITVNPSTPQLNIDSGMVKYFLLKICTLTF